MVRRISSVIRYVWAAPTTVLGLVVVLAAFWRAQWRVVDGVLEAHGPTLAWLLSHLTLMPGGAAALTLGHVVIARDAWSLESTRAHERVHVRQCEAWGLLFVPAYLTASLSAFLRGRNVYFDNRFEVEAFQGCAEPGGVRRTDPTGRLVTMVDCDSTVLAVGVPAATASLRLKKSTCRKTA